jgi:hypothetical protein
MERPVAKSKNGLFRQVRSTRSSPTPAPRPLRCKGNRQLAAGAAYPRFDRHRFNLVAASLPAVRGRWSDRLRWPHLQGGTGSSPPMTSALVHRAIKFLPNKVRAFPNFDARIRLEQVFHGGKRGSVVVELRPAATRPWLRRSNSLLAARMSARHVRRARWTLLAAPDVKSGAKGGRLALACPLFHASRQPTARRGKTWATSSATLSGTCPRHCDIITYWQPLSQAHACVLIPGRAWSLHHHGRLLEGGGGARMVPAGVNGGVVNYAHRHREPVGR